MNDSGTQTPRWARACRRLGILAAVLAVGVPIPVGLVLAWQVHPLLVLPGYLLGIPVWLSLVSATWSGVRRLFPAPEPAPEPATEPVVTTELRLPVPRVEGAPLRTPTP